MKLSKAHLKGKHLLLHMLPHLVVMTMMMMVVMMVVVMLTVLMIVMAKINLLLLLDHPLHFLFTGFSKTMHNHCNQKVGK